MKKMLYVLALLCTPLYVAAKARFDVSFIVADQQASETFVLEQGEHVQALIDGVLLLDGSLEREDDKGVLLKVIVSTMTADQKEMVVLCEPSFDLEWDKELVETCPVEGMQATVKLKATRE